MSSPPGRRRCVGIGTVAAVALLAGACSRSSGEAAAGRRSVVVDGQSVPAAQLTAAVAGLCAAADQAAADPVAAGMTFFDRAHGPIHTIAKALGSVDRKAAARILVAKQAIEADVASHAPGPELAGDLVTLAEATRVGLGRLDVTTKGCGG